MTAHPLDATAEPLAAISDSVRELVEPARHAERYEEFDGVRHLPSKLHWTRHPSLLEQLRDAAAAGLGGDGGTSGGFESRPAARVEAIDQLMRIDQAVDDWLVRRLNVEPRGDLAGNLRQIVGAAPALDAADRKKLQHEAARWVTWARVVTGWDSAPWRPNAACPMCEHKGSLRVRLDERAAACLHCGEAWDSATLGLLADHLRGLNAEVENSRRAGARLDAELTNYFPRLGPCLACRLPVHHLDARHRLIDMLTEHVLDGYGEEYTAALYGVPVEAVLVAVAWSTHPARVAESPQEATA